MNAKQLMEEHPLAKNKLKTWFLNKLTENMEGFEEDDAFKKFMIESGITDDQIETVFKEGGRACLDIFDEYELYISVIYNGTGFEAKINDELVVTHTSDRKTTEGKVLTLALKRLEDILAKELTQIEEENED